MYVADDAQIGYPAVRFGVPDMQFHAWFIGMRTAMEMMVTGDAISGVEAARLGWANRAFPAESSSAVLEIAGGSPDPARHRPAQQARRAPRHGRDGVRAAIRAGTELCALGTHQPSVPPVHRRDASEGLTAALQERDEPFGDYRTTS